MTRKKQTEEDTDPQICSTCNGSGEGNYDGSSCRDCRGRGETQADDAWEAYEESN
jgi:DnaJ-class molecular chaperone